MLGVSHALSGAAVGLAVMGVAGAGVVSGWAAGHVAAAPVDAGGILTFAAVCAGAALLPDLDHPSSMATTRFSWASVAASRVVRPLSALAYRLTRAGRDTGRGTHRGLTHTALFAVGTGLAINAASARWGAPVLLGTLFVCIALAIKGLDALVPGPPSLVIAAGLTYAVDRWVPGGVDGTAGWLGAAVTLGVLVHAVGDAVTESGAPLLWPIPIRGRRWYPVGGPRPVRLRTGGRVETVLVAPGLAVAVVLLVLLVVPGAGALALELRDRVEDLLAARGPG
ncbi:metal-dependent hydrolase [Pseudonocardia sp. D17]|uniref:metal-dependent hydrolase n=1 Tax=Pseudonocardia sp. D17 TaxID=882661 RepID=UPI002B372DEA|nr:hypothetical protein PSD17_12540 [Pseudonocardia sp. D17]